MMRPQLLSKAFIEKISQEQKVKVGELKTSYFSKNFYIFVGIFALLGSLFILYRYLDKKERLELKQKKEEERRLYLQRLEEEREEEEQRRLYEEHMREMEMKSKEVKESSNKEELNNFALKYKENFQSNEEMESEMRKYQQEKQYRGQQDYAMDKIVIDVSPYSDMENKETPILRKRENEVYDENQEMDYNSIHLENIYE